MYYFSSLEKVVGFFAKYNIDITLFTTYEQSVLIILANILQLLFYFFLGFIIFKCIYKIIDWWF